MIYNYLIFLTFSSHYSIFKIISNGILIFLRTRENQFQLINSIIGYDIYLRSHLFEKYRFYKKIKI